MSDQPSGLWRVRKSRFNVDASVPEGNRPLALVILIGLALAIVPIIGFFLPSQFFRDATENALPLIVGILIAPLVVSMLIAILGGWVSGKGSPLAALRQLGALLLVVGSIVLAMLVMRQPNVLTLAGGALLIGFATGVGLTFASGESATYTDAALAMFGWLAFTIPVLLGLIVYIVTFKPTAEPHAIERCFACGGFAIALFVGVTAVPLGGKVGRWLRRGKW